MVTLGVPNMRPATMPQRFDEALAGVHGYVEERGDAVDRDTYRRVAALREPFASWCARLAGMPGAASLDHNDLHPWSLLMGTNSSEHLTAYDWGDSVVAHPFASLLVPLAFARRQLSAQMDDPALLRLRDAYLEAFSDLAPHHELVAALELACHIGKVARALTWERALKSFRPDDADAEEFARAPLGLLGALLDDSYLAGGWPSS